MLSIKETIDPKVFTYQITNEFGEKQPFTVLNLYRHIGYPMRIVQNTMSNGEDAVINLAKRYTPIAIMWYGEQRLRDFYEQHKARLVTSQSTPIQKVLKAYRKYNERTEQYRTPETQQMVEADREALVPIFSQELMKFYLTADNKTKQEWKDDTSRLAFIEILAQRIITRMVIEDSNMLHMELDKETTDIDAAQAKALTAISGGNTAGLKSCYRIYMDNLMQLAQMEVNILYNKIQIHLEGIAKEEIAKQKIRDAEKKKTATATTEQSETATPKTRNARAAERAQDPNRRGKTIKEKKTRVRQTMDESLAALQAKYNRQ